MNRLCFVLNPVAGGGRAKRLAPLIDDTMKRYKVAYDLILTSEPKEAIKIVEEIPHHIVVAVGGDGTVNEVAKGLIKRGFGSLGIIPGGTGNDMSRSLGIPFDPAEAIQAIIGGKTRLVDIGQANKYPFLNIASFGFDAEVVKTTAKIKTKVKGKTAYILGILLTLIRFRKKEVLLEIDGIEYKEKLILLAAGNGKYYGGGMKILPESQLSDGYLYICLIKNINNLLMLFLFPTIFKGTHPKYKRYVSMYKAKDIRIRSQEDIMFNIDGELIQNGKNLNFKLYDYKLPVIHP